MKENTLLNFIAKCFVGSLVFLLVSHMLFSAIYSYSGASTIYLPKNTKFLGAEYPPQGNIIFTVIKRQYNEKPRCYEINYPDFQFIHSQTLTICEH